MKGNRYIGFWMMALLLLAGGALHSVWATNVTYHILTLPIDPTRYDYHMKDAITGWRLEAVKVTENNQSTLELPSQYKSPLATGFTYYKADDILTNGPADNLFDNGPIKGVLYKIRGVDTDDTPAATPVGEGSTLSGSTAHYYVVYTYNASNGIAKLDGSVKYNIRTKYKDKGEFKDKGFIVLNRGRNNRPAVLPTANVNPEMLSSEDFMVASVEGTSVSTYWKDNNNKNKESLVGGKFFFMFKFEGEDPYNIIVRTAYAKDTTYIEKNDGINNFVYKWYKEASLFSVSSGNNCYIASDEHRLYKTAYNSAIANPTNPAYDTRTGNYHGQTGVVWNALSLLNNTGNTGYVFMVSRAVGTDGATPSTLYYLKEKDNRNNLTFGSGNSTDNLSIEGLYPIQKLTFKVATPFYKIDPDPAHIISVADQVSQYTVENDPIETKYLPAALRRKYCNFNGNFYKDAACTEKITYFHEAEYDEDEGYQVYVGYNVLPSAPSFITPAASYDSTTWAKATWYELTDDESTQAHGRKIKWDAETSKYKNNGANGSYEKESEFAFIGDPYELKVVNRKRTATAGGSATYVELSTYNTWDIPYDATAGSFLLHKYNGTGYWSWDAGHTRPDTIAYHDDLTITPALDKNAQTVIINLRGLNGKKYYKISTSGAGVDQIASITPEANNTIAETDTTVTIVVRLKANTSGAAKEMSVTIQEYNNSEGSKASENPANPSVITITQGTASSSFAGNVVSYDAENYTRVKVLDVPKYKYTYKIVDKAGNIAVMASAEQPIFSSLSLASIPSIIVSPFILDEKVTFYDDNYTNGTGRGNLTHKIYETPGAADDIFVTYTTTKLNNKPIKLSENQEFNVVLNGRYLWYTHHSTPSIDSVKTNDAPTTEDVKSNIYLWKLRNLDPYAMLVDNMGARDSLGATSTESVDMYNDDGTSSSQTMQQGAWVDVATLGNAGALSFTTTRANAQRFIAKSSVLTGVYEVMVATGDTIDADTLYYNIGCSATNTVKIYDNAHYIHGNDVLKFRLEQTIPYSYHLIDKSKKELMLLTSQSPDLALPGEYQSPLVATYHFYDFSNLKDTTGGVFEPKADATELESIYDLDATASAPTSSTKEAYDAADDAHKHTDAATAEDIPAKAKKLATTGDHYYKIGETYYHVEVTKPCYTHIYVTYDANERVKFNTGAYMLKFLEPLAEGYHLEDGNDNLTTDKIQAVYPYCNGDGNLNIYGNDMQKEQFNGGASTRPRWVWYFISDDSDPYHVRIRSKSTVNYKSVAQNTYLTTYAVHFNQDASASTKHIVTGGTLRGVAAEQPTEYMVLGTDGEFKLLTTQPISDGVTTDRRKVTSFEQYWKTYNMIKKCVLGIDVKDDATYKDAYSEDTATWVVPAGKRAELQTELDDKGVGSGQWHSYSEYANAVRWNGYNDKSDGHEKKVVEKLEHWYQTFEMGNGTFDIENADIPPVLVLLDLHGWEIMRLPLPTVNYPEGDDELAALRAYDSPWVKEYKFYSQATKATGCHKYTLRMQDGKERDQIKVDGKHYTSTSLADLPPLKASGVKSSGAFNDQFVTYTVKDEYAKSYQYTFTDNGDSTCTESGKASRFLILLGGRFFRDNETPSNPSYFSKPIHEASNPPGGNIYDAILDPSQKTESNVSTNVDENKDGKIDSINLWYVQPNLDIDKEMGIKWGASDDITAAEPLSEYATKKKYKDITGFDPYNVQLKNAASGKFVTSHQTSARLDNGILVGAYAGPGDTTNLTLETGFSYAGVDPRVSTGSEGYDHTNLAISNQTFMAVSDANGNMQLMPRFSHTKRVNLVNNSEKSHTTLQAPVNHAKASASDNSSIGQQTIFFVRAQVIEYHIINNSGKEALRYKRSGEYYPAISDHFKSPIATNFTYYSGVADTLYTAESDVVNWSKATGVFQRALSRADMLADDVNLLPDSGSYYYRIGTRGRFSYKKVEVTKGLSAKKITGSFAEAGLKDDDCVVKVRYEYDAGTDHDGDRVLEGRWFSAKLADKDLKAEGTITVKDDPETGAVEVPGTGVLLKEGDSKPSPVGENEKIWQWKFLSAPADPSSDYYVAPDPYDVQIYNRQANYTKNPSEEPSPMAVGIKVPNDGGGVDHFALLSHDKGGYALAVAGTKAYTYKFLNGTGMTTSAPADTATETSFTQKAGIFTGLGSQLFLIDDVERHFTYRVINNSGKFAVGALQDNAGADAHQYLPYLPDSAQSPLLNIEDYQYYGFAGRDRKDTPDDESDDTYSVIPQTILHTLYGLYDDTVYVRYDEYNMDKTSFKVPNQKTTVDGHVARGPKSIDVSMNIKGELPYNIVWYSDTTMKAIANKAGVRYDSIDYQKDQNLSGDSAFVWYFTGNDPYALRIKHKGGKYLNGEATMVDSAAAQPFMLLRKADYDYGVLQVTGITGANAGKKLTGYGAALTPNVATAPTKFIVFGLSVHDLIYRLIIAKTCPDKTYPQAGEYVDIPYRETVSGDSTGLRIYGTTQRDLTSVNSGAGTHYAGEKYQLGDTVKWNGEYHTYSHHAGPVSIGDELVVPNVFARPNCTFKFYVEGVYSYSTTAADDDKPIKEMNDKYRGLRLDKLMSDDKLIDQTVVVNVVYEFDTTLATNTGLGFVTSTDQNLWYTFETQQGATPYLAHYTNAWGLQSMAGEETRYTNDYLWTPLGDVYGFKMYNRYMLKNSGGVQNVMTMKSPFAENDTLLLAEPGPSYPAGNEIFELIKGDVDGYFRVHPVINTKEQTQYYVRRDPTDNYTKLSTTPCDWTFGLDMTLLEPYYERAGYVGGLTDDGKAAYEAVLAEEPFKIIDLQAVVYNDANIVHYEPGYYRMHNQPGVSGISPVRYASGYLHDIERTAVDGGIPMHFFSREGVSRIFKGTEDDLGTGFTITNATRGDIPIAPTETDPSTIFYIPGGINPSDTVDTHNPRVTIQTQGLYVASNDNGDAEKGTGTSRKQRAVMSANADSAITFSLMDIGGAVLLIHDGKTPAVRRYLNYDQSKADSIYDLRYYHESPTDDAKWCLQPVQKTPTAGNGEMPLVISTNQGGDGYYYATFYAPFDVLLPNDKSGSPDTTYNAYICKKWHDEGVNPSPVPAHGDYLEGKFVPAGTPVILRTNDESNTMTLTLPSASPSPALACDFTGSYLEKSLKVDASHDVYTFGLPMTSEVHKDGDYDETGDIYAPKPEFATSGVGFYINATPDKESDPIQSLWQRKNNYVLHNKIYYRATGGGPASAPERKGVEYVPVNFGDEDDWQDYSQGQQRVGCDGVYDILGRKVASEAAVKDGTWYQGLAPGVYIVDGQKIYLGY